MCFVMLFCSNNSAQNRHWLRRSLLLVTQTVGEELIFLSLSVFEIHMIPLHHCEELVLLGTGYCCSCFSSPSPGMVDGLKEPPVAGFGVV